MPEEINRVLTDAISDLHFCTEQATAGNLAREGVDAAKVHLVGNLMVDSLLVHRARAERSEILADPGVAKGSFGVVTLHRPSNVDDRRSLSEILAALGEIQAELPLIVPAHLRLRAVLGRSGALCAVADMQWLRVVEPLGYLDFLQLTSAARVVLTDSGGIQDETTILGVPCLTLRENTERPVTIEHGTNPLVGTNAVGIVAAFRTPPKPLTRSHLCRTAALRTGSRPSCAIIYADMRTIRGHHMRCWPPQASRGAHEQFGGASMGTAAHVVSGR